MASVIVMTAPVVFPATPRRTQTCALLAKCAVVMAHIPSRYA